MKAKGFILSYILFILTIILSIVFVINQSTMSKIKIEHNLIEIEKQKCIELILYSYFMNDQSECLESFEVHDYTIAYHGYHKNDLDYLDVIIENSDYKYSITYIYDPQKEYIIHVDYA